MKSSTITSATSGRNGAAGPRSNSPRLTPSAEEFALSGPSNDPDPRTHAFRKDLADIALAGRVIASHYAAPVERRLSAATDLRETPAADGAPIAALPTCAPFLMLDDSLGWAWGYGGPDRLVGYVPSDLLDG